MLFCKRATGFAMKADVENEKRDAVDYEVENAQDPRRTAALTKSVLFKMDTR